MAMKGLPILLAFTLSVEACLPAWALASSCDGAMDLTAPLASDDLQETKARFATVLHALQKYELTRLLDGQRSGKTAVRFEKHVVGKPPLEIQWHSRMPVLLVRHLDLSTPELMEKALWNVAESFYRIEMRRSYALSMAKPPSSSSEKPTTLATYIPHPMTGLGLFRDTRLQWIADLQIDLYRLIEKLPTLDREALFRTRAPGASVVVKSLLFDPGRYISVNKEDFNIFERFGHSGVRQAVLDNHRIAIFRSYLINRIRQWCFYAALGIAGGAVVLIKTFGSPPVSTLPDSNAKILRLEEKFHSGEATPAEKQDLYNELSRRKRGLEGVVLKNADLNGIERVANELRELRRDDPTLDETQPQN